VVDNSSHFLAESFIERGYSSLSANPECKEKVEVMETAMRFFIGGRVQRIGILTGLFSSADK
jgi:hypothetical protein